MTYQLIPADQAGRATIPVHRPVLLIGRHPECDFRIDLPQISRRHCCMALAYDRIVIRDLGSHNGVRVNGRVVQEAILQAGDELAIGPLIYRLVADSSIPSSLATSGSRPGPARVKPAGAALAGTQASPPLPGRSDDDDIDLVPLDDL
jgi:pSer/pThr/pTyr-binding forkhead associated (FHA) protein